MIQNVIILYSISPCEHALVQHSHFFTHCKHWHLLHLPGGTCLHSATKINQWNLTKKFKSKNFA